MQNALWLTVVTMTTVGFGDFFARTYIGRIVSVVACFYGVFLVSLMVVALTRITKFKNHQKKSFNSVMNTVHYR